jgi:hypothetical protein
MKINSKVLTIVAVLLAAIFGYCVGISKQTKATETKIKHSSIPKKDIFDILTEKTTNQLTYDKHNWPPGATGYIYADGEGYTWVYSNPIRLNNNRNLLPNAYIWSPHIAENGSFYGEISKTTGRPKTVYVQGYYRKDGTYVRGHYRSKPRR